MTPKQNHRRIGGTSSKKPKTASRTAKRRPSAIEDPELPESGSVGDTSRLSSKNLPYPRIISDLQLPEITKDSMWTRADIQVNLHLAAVYSTGVVQDASGREVRFKDTTNPVQGRHLYNCVVENGYTHSLEIGLAMGASAAWLCQAHVDIGGAHGRHVAIDPNQKTQYANIGRELVRQCGLADVLEVIEAPSYRALPTLFSDVLAGRRPRFDLIYIDGWHTFDYTLVDFFYADLLLEVNGMVVLDDIKHPPVKKLLAYVVKNYPHYRLVPRTPCFGRAPALSSQATFIKIREDSRAWNHHAEF